MPAVITKRNKSPEFLADLVECTADVLQRLGALAPRQADWLAHEVADKMRAHWGGCQIYFPKGLEVDISERDREIYRAFDGANHHQLAKDYGVSITWIYQVIRRIRLAELRKSRHRKATEHAEL